MKQKKEQYTSQKKAKKTQFPCQQISLADLPHSILCHIASHFELGLIGRISQVHYTFLFLLNLKSDL